MARLDNLEKLHLLPVLALRRLLAQKLANDESSLSEIVRLTREQLIQAIDREPTITEDDLQTLYELYRYGRRLAIQIFLLPEDYSLALDDSTIQQILARLRDAAPSNEEETNPGEEDNDNFGWDEVKGRVNICDHERFGDVLEIRFKYPILHRYLNLDEDADQVCETRYGYVWLSPQQHYLAVLAKDNSVAARLLNVVARVLNVQPKAVQFPRTLIDQHFDIEDAKRFTHLDVDTGVRQSISGNKDALARYNGEIVQRDSRYTRPSVLYDEVVDGGMVSGLGISAKTGRLYFTRTLSATQVHGWVNTRLCEFIADLRATLADQPVRVYQASSIVRRQRKLDDHGKMLLELILDAIATAKRDRIHTIPVSVTPEALYAALGNAWLRPRYGFSCPECEDACGFCPYCSSTRISSSDREIVCSECHKALTVDGIATLACVNHHIHQFAVAESMGVLATDKLQRLIGEHLQDLGLEWRFDKDHIYVDAEGLHHLLIPADTSITNIFGDNINATVGRNTRNINIGKQISVDWGDTNGQQNEQ
ncbi:MAG: hypothetical protein U0X20_20385 [Caldilineaceae bacterium]